MKKIYNLNENDVKNLDLKNDWDYRVEKTFGVEVPEIDFSFIKENILDSVMNDIEVMFQNTEGIISDDYILTCESEVKENRYDGNIITLKVVTKQKQNSENLQAGYIEPIVDFIGKIKFNNLKDLVIYYDNFLVSKRNNEIKVKDNTGFSCNRLWKELISNNLFRKYKNFEFISRSLSLKIEDGKFKYFKMCDLDKVILFKDNKIEKWSLTNDMLNTILDCKNLNFYDMLNELNLDDVLNNVFISAHDIKDYKTLCIYPLKKKCDISIPYLTRLSKRVDKTYRIKNMYRIKDIEVSPYSISYKKDVSVNDLILEWTKLISKHLEVIKKDIFLSVECKNGSICFKEGYLVIDYYDEKDFNKEFFEGFNADFIIIVKTKTFFYMVC